VGQNCTAGGCENVCLAWVKRQVSRATGKSRLMGFLLHGMECMDPIWRSSITKRSKGSHGLEQKKIPTSTLLFHSLIAISVSNYLLYSLELLFCASLNSLSASSSTLPTHFLNDYTRLDAAGYLDNFSFSSGRESRRCEIHSHIGFPCQAIHMLTVRVQALSD